MFNLYSCSKKTLLIGHFMHFEKDLYIPYILKSNPHPFYSFRGLKFQMQVTITYGIDSRSRVGFWKNDRAVVRAVRTIQYSNLLFYLLLTIDMHMSYIWYRALKT
jgi:hypothetical protein